MALTTTKIPTNLPAYRDEYDRIFGNNDKENNWIEHRLNIINKFKEDYKYLVQDSYALESILARAVLSTSEDFNTNGEIDFFKIMVLAFRKLESLGNVNSIEMDDSRIYQSTSETSKLVAVRPCGEEYKGKTYLGIMTGEIALSVSGTAKNNTMVLSRTMYNPAIYVPVLKKMIFGIESWWRVIDKEEDLVDITETEIGNTWYVKLLKDFDKNSNK